MTAVAIKGNVSERTAQALKDRGFTVDKVSFGIVVGSKEDMERYRKVHASSKVEVKEVFKIKGAGPDAIYPSKILALKAKLKGKVKHFQRLNKAEVIQAIEALDKGNTEAITSLEQIAQDRSAKYAQKRGGEI